MNTAGLLHHPDLMPDLMIHDLENTIHEMAAVQGPEHGAVRRLEAWLTELRKARDLFLGDSLDG